MSDTAPEQRFRARRWLIAIAFVAVAIGVGVVWVLDYPSGQTGPTASVPLIPASESQAAAARDSSTSKGMAKSLDELQQQVKDLEAARQALVQQLDSTKRQLSEAEGDIKLMSEQLGALSERVDGLAGSRASIPRGAVASQRRRAKSR